MTRSEGTRWGILAAFTVATIALVALHVLESAPDELSRPMSAYALGRHEWIWRIALIAISVGMVLEGTRRGWQRLAVPDIATVFAGIAMLFIAIFRTDPWYPWERMPTPVGAVHVFSTFVLMTAFGVAALSSRGDRTRLMLGRAYVGTFVASLVGVLIAIVTGREASFIGLAERIMVGLALAWLFIAARQAPRSPANEDQFLHARVPDGTTN